MASRRSPEPEAVTLVEAADALGVHYQTVYGWVRDGTLRAQKVGKSYRVETSDLERLRRRRSSGSRPPTVRVRDWAAQVDRLHLALRDGDEHTASEQVGRLLGGGLPVVDLCERLLAPALRRIGDEWAAGRCTVAEEHRASAICERLLASVPPRRTRHRGVAVVGTPEGERHGLPAQMAAAALRHDGWRVHDLSTDLPTHELEAFVERERVDLVVLSGTVREAAAVARRLERSTGVPVLAGRAGDTLGELVTAARQIS